MERLGTKHNVGWLVSEAMKGAEAEHGPLTTDHGRALNILMEEVGECSRAYLEMTRPDADHNSWAKLVEELAQVAATTQNIMWNLLEEHSRG